MSPTKDDRIIRSISGNTFPPQHVAEAIARALHREYDKTRAAVKTVVWPAAVETRRLVAVDTPDLIGATDHAFAKKESCGQVTIGTKRAHDDREWLPRRSSTARIVATPEARSPVRLPRRTACVRHSGFHVGPVVIGHLSPYVSREQ